MQMRRAARGAALCAIWVGAAAFSFPVAAKMTGYAAPPSDYEALQAVQTRIEEKSAESYFAGAGGPVSGRTNFPIDIQLFRCDENPDRLLPAANGYTQRVSGYGCVVGVFPAAEPAYRVGGFFYFDGLSWRYYGPLRPPDIIEIDKFEQSQEASVLRPKPGAINYQGFTGEDNSNPYDLILGRSED